MAIIQISKLQQRSGNIVDLPQLDEAEFGWATDVKRLYIGKTTPNENVEVLTSYSNIAFSQLNGSYGNLDIDGGNIENGQVMTFDGTNWTNRGGNIGGLITLGDVANVKILGGAISYVLTTDGTGNLSWSPKSTIIAFIQNATQADPGVITTTEDNFFVNGAEVTITNCPGMVELNGNTYYANVLTSNSFSLYSDSALTTTVDTSGFTEFPNTTATATNGTNQRITVTSSTAFTVNDPIKFIGTTFGGIVADVTYYVKTKPTSTTLTISETLGGGTFLVTTDSGSCTVYATGGRVISLAEGSGGAAVAAGSNTMIQYNNLNLLSASADLTFDFNSTPRLLTVNGNANVGNLNANLLVTANRFSSNVATGTPPIAVSSTTRVANLNVDYANVSDFNLVTLQTTGTFFPTFVNGSATANRALGANANLSFNVATGNLATNILFANSNVVTSNVNSVSTTGGNLTINGAIQSTLNTTGGNINILSGNGNGTGTGGVLQLTSGNGGTTDSTGGQVNITAGGGNGTGTGGAISLVAGNSTGLGATITLAGGGNTVSGQGGNLTVSAGSATGTDKTGGTLTVSSGRSTGAGTVTSIVLQTPTVTTTGSTLQTLANRVVINSTAINVLPTTAATSTTTGALIVAGGVGISGNLFVGDNLTVTSNISGSLLTGTLTTAAQPNITSVGTLTSLTVSGNISAGNVSGTLLTGTLVTAAQPNVTSVGTLTNLNVSGNITASNITANTGVFTGNGSGLSQLNASNISSGTLAQARLANSALTLGNTIIILGTTTTTVTGLSSLTSTNFIGTLTGSATTSGTVTTAAQPNITSVGTLVSLIVTGAINSGSLSTGPITGTTIAGTLTTAAQPNVTSVGTLTGLTVSGNISTGNITATGNSTASLFVGNLRGTSITTGSNVTAGSITGNWSLTAGSQLQATYADLAEYYNADDVYEPGTVLEFGGINEVTIATDGTTKVAGVVSTSPAYAMNSHCEGEYPTALALQGRVPTKVRGKISKGDMMVSGGNGYARPCTSPVLGSVIGKALENFDGYEGIIEIAIGRL